MAARRKRASRVLLTPRADNAAVPVHLEAPRLLRKAVIDFSSLSLPIDVRRALADAFWNHFGVRDASQISTHWSNIKVFTRFTSQHPAFRTLADINGDLLSRYVEWLNAQRRTNGQPWAKASRASAYNTLRTLLRWLARCRPRVLGEVHFPFNPFPLRNRDQPSVRRVTARALRAILRSCERDISALRRLREQGERERAVNNPAEACSIGKLLDVIDQRYGGIVPSHHTLTRAGHHPVLAAFRAHGGTKGVEPYLYPRAESLLSYYLAILIHTAGNPGAIAELSCDCLQPIPLLDDRQMLVWNKRRAGVVQRRSFRSDAAFDPPALVRELLQWTHRLRPQAPKAAQQRLFVFKGARGINAWSAATAKHVIKHDFLSRHGLPHFSLASVRPSVLSTLYRASGDLQQAKAAANHQQINTTIRYVQGPEVEAQHRLRISALQSAFLGHVSRSRAPEASAADQKPPGTAPVPRGAAVSMFGFDCKDPLSGIAPGTRQGELCPSFLGCFTCPNAIITADASSIGRLLQARDHLLGAATRIHPARWEAIYAPLLRILEEDILTRFTASELADGSRVQHALPPLPDLR
jgi:hypothetical protein